MDAFDSLTEAVAEMLLAMQRKRKAGVLALMDRATASLAAYALWRQEWQARGRPVNWRALTADEVRGAALCRWFGEASTGRRDDPALVAEGLRQAEEVVAQLRLTQAG